MDINIAFCGLSCELCPIRWKTLENDTVKKEKIVKQIIKTGKELLNYDLKVEDITDCDGCKIKDGRLFSTCQKCFIRECAMEKGIENCAYCDHYPCADLTKKLNKLPESKDRLDTINAAYKK
jgi:hypothetical protein